MKSNLDYTPYLDQVRGLYPMPQIMAKLSRSLKDPNADIDEMEELIASDTTLVSSILRLCNSSFFGFSDNCSNLSEAIQRLGFREIVRLIGVCAAAEAYEKELKRYRIPPEVFWESGIAAALLMERLAKQTGLDSEEAYICGLMREIGMLVIDRLLVGEKLDGCWDNLLPVRDWETERCGFEHSKVGSALLQRWGFSTGVQEAVANQYYDDSSLEVEEMDLGILLRLSNRILDRCGCDFSVAPDSFDCFYAEAARLSLEPEQFETVISDAADNFERLRSV
ncbi:MAG: HDOD domain-containing protein, partial [Verrucomicrobiota bacterium]